MMKVGLTGGIASGKSTVAKRFSEYGIAVIDADSIARELTQTGHSNLQAIANQLGAEYINPDGALERSKLRKLISEDKQARIWLEQLLHPQIRTIMQQRATQAPPPYCILDIPLLAESQSDYGLDRILVIDCPENTQIQRLMVRDQLTEQAAKAMLATQASRTERLAIADDVILNDGDLEQLYNHVDKLHQQYISL